MTQDDWRQIARNPPPELLSAAEMSNFCGKHGEFACIAAPSGSPGWALIGFDAAAGSVSMFRALAGRLPGGDYIVDAWPAGVDPDQVWVEWCAGAYRFDRYKKNDVAPPRRARLLSGHSSRAEAIAEACALARDLINTPANDMGPAELETAARKLAQSSGAVIDVTMGTRLVDGYPAIHAVGRAAGSARAPKMIEISWGQEAHPLVALVGKGVTFDTGGLDIKASAGMRWMKKDMGGAAHALALAGLIMKLGLPVRLAVLLPIAENAIAGDAMRPGDVIATRKRLSVEIGNTDAEGRLILADALTRASELMPDLTIDLATLTGAARVALGPDVAPFYTDDDRLAADLESAGRAGFDPIWRMPLWSGYEDALKSDIADLKNDADAWAQAGSITAALFLKRFAPPGPWIHFDIFAWNARSRPGWPQGGEAQAIRAIFAMLEVRYSK